MNKRIAAIALLLLLAALLIAPNLVGGGIQSATVDNILAMVPEDADELFDIRQTDFQRGWFGSNAQIEITIDELTALVGEPVALLLDLEISHGPVLLTPAGIRLGLAHADIEPTFTGVGIEALFADGQIETDEPLINLFAAFDNTIELNFALDNFRAGTPEASLAVTGLQGSSVTHPDLSSEAMIELEAMEMRSAGGAFDLALENVVIDGTQSDLSSAISPGRSSLSLARVSSEAPLPVAATSVTAIYALQEQQETSQYLNLSQQFRVERLSWDLPVTAVQWQLELAHLNRQLIERYIQLAQESRQGGATEPSQVSAQLTGLGQELVLDLLAENLTLDSQLRLTAYDGEHSLELNFDWPGIAGLGNFQTLDMQQLLHTAQVTLLLDADQAALMNSPFAQTVIDYQRPGFLAVGGGRVTSTIRLADGLLDINGEVTPLETFINL